MPFLTLFLSLAVGFAFDHFITPDLTAIVSGVIKVLGFSAIYLGLLMVFDRKEMKVFYRLFNQHIIKHLLE